MDSIFPSRNGHVDCDCEECIALESTKLETIREIDDFLLASCSDGEERAILATACDRFISMNLRKPEHKAQILGKMIYALTSGGIKQLMDGV